MAGGIDQITPAAVALLAARNSLAAYAVAQQPTYELAPHAQIVIEHLEALERGDFRKLMIFCPPQHGKEMADSTPVLTANRGWVTHGELQPGDYVFHPSGRPVCVLATVEQPEPCSLEVETFDGAKLKVHPNHEWTVWDRALMRWRTMETREFVTREVLTDAVVLRTGLIRRAYRPTPSIRAVNLTSGTPDRRGHRARFMLPVRAPLEFPRRAFTVAPYIVGAWLGDGTRTEGCITHAASDSAVALAVGQDFEPGAVYVHPTTGVLRSHFNGLFPRLRRLGLDGNKHIPAAYQQGSIPQRLELLAGLIDTDGAVHRPTQRVTFSNTNRRLVDGVTDLIRSFGWRATIATFAPALSSSGIQGKRTVYQVTFSPDVEIPTRLPRKSTKGFKPTRRRTGIKAVRTCAPERGRCIQVDAPDGLYLAGAELVPTHNSLICAKIFPAWYMGRHPDHPIILSSYSQELVEDHSLECRDFMTTEFHKAIFPDCQVDERYTAKHDFRTTKKGAVRAVGKGASVTGRSSRLSIFDDMHKDREDARSETEQRKAWTWWNTVAHTRLSADGRMLYDGTRWDPMDLAGQELAQHAGDWKVLELPAVAERDEGWRQEGEPLWAARYPLEWLESMRDRMARDDWLAMYQGRPTRDGDERVFADDWFQFIVQDLTAEQLKTMPGFILGDPANKKKKRRDRTGIWVVALGADQNVYFLDGRLDRLGLSERWQALKGLHQKWGGRFKKLWTFWEEFGMTSDIEYFRERMEMENYRIHIEQIGSNQISKEQLIKDFGQGICKDRRVWWQKDIPAQMDGKQVNLTRFVFEHEWIKYPAVSHDDGLNSAAYVTDKKIMSHFPKPKRDNGVDEMLANWKRRRAGITPMGV